MDDKARACKIIELLEETYKDVKGTVLKHKTPFQLLIATILSAQATDAQINKVTKDLFKKYKKPEDYVHVPIEELENDIRSSGFFHRKADAIKETSKTIVEKHNGRVPDTMEELVELKGVARKTANIVLSGAFGKIEGIAVDTHVYRLSRRLGFSEHKNRDKVEQDLMKLIPREKWYATNYLIITHGRRVCQARKPLCGECALTELCPSAYNFPHFKED
jgi:endonuclease-3